MATSGGYGGFGGGGGGSGNNNADSGSGLVTAYPAEVITSPTSCANSAFRGVVNGGCTTDNLDDNAAASLLIVPQWKRELIQRRRQSKQQQQQHHQSCAADPVRSSTTSTTTTTVGSVAARGGACSTAATAAAADTALITSSTAESDAAMRLEAAVGGDQARMKAANNMLSSSATTKQQDDCESDSSEELQYGPGIVHKLRSRYLNMTLREMNKNRSSVQCFRRAASLEDLLDHKDDSPDKSRRYAKKNVTGAAAKVERYRNAARGNESMKRARSVETLMRYHSAPEESNNQNHSASHRFVANAFKQENDHIILVDRTTVKIENRLLDKDRLKPPVNKPKRIKPVLAETERPPPDLVKTTLRIFESSSLKKLKPKGEVAVKVATFKTINETFKAQNQKKIIPKPPLQPKPFTNGNSRLIASPRKIIVTRKPTAELIEQQNNSQEAYHNDNVITDPIVQSVSSVVSKFQQIEKSCSPVSSPEPTFNKIKFSPAASPEPSLTGNKTKVSSLDIKSPTITPIPSPRTTPPKAQSPLSPRVEFGKPPSGYLHNKPASNSTPLASKYEQSKTNSVSSELPKLDFEKEKDRDEPAEEQVKETTLEINNQNLVDVSELLSKANDSSSSSEASTLLVESFEEVPEVVDSPRSVTKSALDNIGKAGMTVQFSFSESPAVKNYLPRSASSPAAAAVQETEDDDEGSLEYDEPEADESKPAGATIADNNQFVPAACVVAAEVESPMKAAQDRLLVESYDEIIYKEEPPPVLESSSSISRPAPIGAISSLSLIKSTTTTSYSQGNESKTIRSQKSESNSPPQKQIGIIRPLVSTKTQLPQQNLSNREIEKNLINRVKSIEQQQQLQQPTKVVVSLKSAEEIHQPPVKKSHSAASAGGGGLWDAKPWNQQNNTMVFNFSNRKDVPDYIENDGLIITRKRDKPRQSSDDNNVSSNIDNVQLTDDSDSELSVGPPSPCDVAFYNDNVLINGRSNLSRTPRNHKHRIQFDDTATRTFEYPSEASMLLHEAVVSSSSSASAEGSSSSNVDGNEASASGEVAGAAAARGGSGTLPSLLVGSGLASYTPSKVDLASDGFELGVTRATVTTLASPQSIVTSPQQDQTTSDEVDYLKPSQDPQTWGQETAADMLY